MPRPGTLLTNAPYNISGVHVTPPWVTGAVRAASGAQDNQSGPGKIGPPEDNIRLDGATLCLQGEGLGRDVATGHFGLFICFFPGFSIIPFWGAFIFILAFFRWCCTPSWGPASCSCGILILGPNFRAFIPIKKNASVTEIDQNTTCDINTISLVITFCYPSVTY